MTAERRPITIPVPAYSLPAWCRLLAEQGRDPRAIAAALAVESKTVEAILSAHGKRGKAWPM